MSNVQSRRDLAKLFAVGGVATAGLLAGCATSAVAYQGNMERALSSLYDALGSLREASSNKGGHRVAAMDLIRQATEQVQEGIDYADDRP